MQDMELFSRCAAMGVFGLCVSTMAGALLKRWARWAQDALSDARRLIMAALTVAVALGAVAYGWTGTILLNLPDSAWLLVSFLVGAALLELFQDNGWG